MTRIFKAYWGGQYTTAERCNGQWYIGGDKAPGSDNIQILLERDDRPAWFSLKGNRLTFDDYA